MSFHESFWVAAGAAAPVIALAVVVSLNDASQTQFAVGDATDRAFVVAHRDEKDVLYRSLDKRGRSLAALTAAQLVNLVLQAGLLAVSLVSLALHRNLIPAWICVVAPTAGVLLLAYAGLAVTNAQGLMRNYQRALERLEKGQENRAN